ncbi:hypothetical protein TNCV_4627301 [Trichonephila clavipes]|nr:hypothetical protein TNCV_4627301 [Trichonephila clavipes]
MIVLSVLSNCPALYKVKGGVANILHFATDLNISQGNDKIRDFIKSPREMINSQKMSFTEDSFSLMEGKGSVEDDERFGSPQTSRTAENTEKVSVRRYVRTGFKQRRGMKMKTTVLPHPPLLT